MLIAWSQLLEQERLADALAIDTRYHVAKLTAAAMSDKPALIWEEHESVRRELLFDPPPAVIPDDLMARAAALWKRCRDAEARHGAH